MKEQDSIVLGYIGVHQIFQLALAAHEMGKLERLHCSLLDAPKKWGSWLGGRVNAASLRPLGSDRIPPHKTQEIPLPILSRQLARLLPWRTNEHYHASNSWFDRTLARRLARSRAGLFVGVETCALRSLRQARQQGMKTLLDCPGIPAQVLEMETLKACDELRLPYKARRYSSETAERRAQEMESADLVTVCSLLQYRHYAEAGFPEQKMRINPLWVDEAFASRPPKEHHRQATDPLRVLFVGSATVSKGAPYAIQATQLIGEKARLTFCGGVDETVRQWAGNKLERCSVLSWQPRSSLPEVYAAHDVLVFPTLGDSFGFVALEAMACGLPVITTTQAGAPLPDESWRVPTRDPEALATRILLYANNHDLLAQHSRMAQDFSRDFTPTAFRLRACNIFSELLKS